MASLPPIIGDSVRVLVEAFRTLLLSLNQRIPDTLRFVNSKSIRELSQRMLAVLLALSLMSPGVVAVPVMDADGDGLPNVEEWTANVDWQEADTDGDELSDSRERSLSEFNATNSDTDQDGLNDSKEAELGSNASLADTDQDGINDTAEVRYGTDPNQNDTDGDSLSDSKELDGNTSAVAEDTDGDGLNDDEELEIGSNPTESDTDSDLLPDGREQELNTSLTTWDTDQDSLSDLREVGSEKLNPRKADTDSDGINDSRELEMATLVNVSDTDDDNLKDGPELANGTSPIHKDTDNDTLLDGAEVLLYSSDPLTNDTDLDNVSDPVEVEHDRLNVTNSDGDDDRLDDGVEWYGQTNVTLADTDNDGLGDWNETKALPTDPIDNDTDSDGLLDGNETLRFATEPLDSDTDGDEIPDGTEVTVQDYSPNKSDSLHGKNPNLEITGSQANTLGSFIDALVRVSQSIAKDNPNAGPLTEYSQAITKLPAADFTGPETKILKNFKQAGLYQILDIVQKDLGVGPSSVALKGRVQQAISVGARMSAVLAVVADYATLHDQAEKLVNATNETATQAAQIGVIISTAVLVIDAYLLYQTGGTFSLASGHKLAFAGTGKIAAKTKLARLAKYCSWKCVGGVERLLHWSLRSLIDIGETQLIGAIIQIGYYDVTGVSIVDLLEGIPSEELAKLATQLGEVLTGDVLAAFQEAINEVNGWFSRKPPNPAVARNLNYPT